MKSTIFWDITPCGPLSVNRCFEGTYRLHLQDRKNKLSKKPAWKQVASFHAGYFLSLFFRPWIWRRYVPPNRRLTLNGLHGVISQKMVLYYQFIRPEILRKTMNSLVLNKKWSIHPSIHPMALQPVSGLGLLLSVSLILHYRQFVGLLGRVISPSQGRYLHRTTQTQNKRKHPCL
jgi:hypothetical protein